MDGPDADRVRLVPAGGEQPGEATALLRPAVPAGGGGRDLLRAARRADRAGLGRTYAGRLHLQHQGVQPVHPAPDAGQGVPGRPARGGGFSREGPGVPQGRRPGGGGGGLGPVPGRARPAARRGQAGRDPAAVPAVVPDRPGAPGVHPGLRAAGRAGPGVRGVPQPHLDDRGQPARNAGLPGRAPAPVRVRGHAAGLPELHPAGAGRHQRPGRGPDARALGQVDEQGDLGEVRLPVQRSGAGRLGGPDPRPGRGRPRLTHVLFNNCYRDWAHVNAQQLTARLPGAWVRPAAPAPGA